MLNFLKLAVNAFHDATKQSYVQGKLIFKCFQFKFTEIRHIPGTFIVM